MAFRGLGWIVAAAVLAASGAAAAPSAGGGMTDRTEKLSLKGKKAKGGLGTIGYAIGEYAGEGRFSSFRFRALGDDFRKDSSKGQFTVSREGMAPVTIACGGGESRSGLGWIEFDRDDLEYNCSFQGGPSPASFRLALSKGGLLARLTMPQRAAELQYGRIVLRARTKSLGGLPMGRTSYVFERDGEEIGGIDFNRINPAIYLPPAGSPDRDAAAVAALILYFFRDPANQND